MTPEDNPLEAFRRGREHDQRRRSTTSAPPSARTGDPAGLDDLDALIESRRAEALRRALTDQPVVAPTPRAPSPATRAPATPPTRTRADDPPPATPSPLPDPGTAAPRRKTAPPEPTGQLVVRTLNIPAVLMRRLRLLQASRDQDYIDLIAEAVANYGPDVPFAEQAVKRRSRVRGEKVTLKVPKQLDRDIDALATARHLNRSAFVSTVIDRLLAAVPLDL